MLNLLTILTSMLVLHLSFFGRLIALYQRNYTRVKSLSAYLAVSILYNIYCIKNTLYSHCHTPHNSDPAEGRGRPGRGVVERSDLHSERRPRPRLRVSTDDGCMLTMYICINNTNLVLV